MEEKESELEEFIDNATIVMGTLGHRIFDPLIETKQIFVEATNAEDSGLLLFLKRKTKKSGQVIEARCKRTREGFVVLKGSHIETIDSDSIPTGIKISRAQAQIDDIGILQGDVLFNSPSYAAAFVIGGHANGLTEWKTADGRSLKEIESNEGNEV